VIGYDDKFQLLGQLECERLGLPSLDRDTAFPPGGAKGDAQIYSCIRMQRRSVALVSPKAFSLGIRSANDALVGHLGRILIAWGDHIVGSLCASTVGCRGAGDAVASNDEGKASESIVEALEGNPACWSKEWLAR